LVMLNAIMGKKILGISAFYHDSAAALIEDGIIIAAVQEERFTRKKHDETFPVNAIKFYLAYSG
jgi:carbamoyltransferase